LDFECYVVSGEHPFNFVQWNSVQSLFRVGLSDDFVLVESDFSFSYLHLSSDLIIQFYQWFVFVDFTFKKDFRLQVGFGNILIQNRVVFSDIIYRHVEFRVVFLQQLGVEQVTVVQRVVQVPLAVAGSEQQCVAVGAAIAMSLISIALGIYVLCIFGDLSHFRVDKSVSRDVTLFLLFDVVFEEVEFCFGFD